MGRKEKRRFGIKQKISVFSLVSFFIVVIAGLGLMYRSEYDLLQQTIGRDYVLMAKNLAEAMDRIINREIKSTEVFMSSADRLAKVEECNLKYTGMSQQAKEAYFKDMDQKWMKASGNGSLVVEYTNGPLGNRLREIVRDDSSSAEIFMTDKFGGLVAASDRTSDFYQADEEWWQKAYALGRGSIFVDSVGWDASSGAMGIALAVPIRNRSKEVIGICKNFLEIDRLFSPLRNLYIGKSGHVELIDRKGNLIFHPRIKSMTQSISGDTVEKIIQNNSGYMLIPGKTRGEKRTILSYYKVYHSALLDSNIEWWICIVQDGDEVFAPLRTLVWNFVLAAIIMLGLVVFSGFLLGALLVEPIAKLRNAVFKVAKGDFEHKVEIRTNDEIEDLADSFNLMLENLKNSFTTVDMLNRQIILRKKTEEEMRLSEERYRMIFVASKEAILILSPQGSFVSGNPAAVKLFACRDEKELCMMKLADLSPERQPDGTKSTDLASQMILLALKNGEYKFKWVHRRLNGEDFEAEVMLAKFELSGKVLLQTVIRQIAKS